MCSYILHLHVLQNVFKYENINFGDVKLRVSLKLRELSYILYRSSNFVAKRNCL